MAEPEFVTEDRPCRTERLTRRLDSFCDECPHVLVFHREDLTCELCAIRRELFHAE